MLMKDARIKHMVDRFLSWKLPRNFSPDNGVSSKRPNYAPEVDWRIYGTNLLDADQADAMVRHMVDGLPREEAERKAALWDKEGWQDLDAIRTDIDQLRAEAKWRPISEAPKHGRQIVVGFQGQFSWFSFIADAHGEDTHAAGYARPTHFRELFPPTIGGSNG